MASMIKKDDDDFHSYEISIQDFNSIVGIENEAGYTRTKELTEKILTRVLKIREPDGVFISIGCLLNTLNHKVTYDCVLILH
jgi:hypothetical protein